MTITKNWEGCCRASNRLADLVCAMYHPKDDRARKVWPTATWAEIIAAELGIKTPSDDEPEPKTIKAILDCINSESDYSGNRYWAFRYTDCATGKQVCGNISGGESNISAILQYMPGTNKDGFTDWESVYYTRHEMKKREFRRLTAEWQYAGCRPEDEIVPFILKKLATYNDSNAEVRP